MLAIHAGRRAELWDTATQTIRAQLQPAGGLAWSPDKRHTLIDRGNWPRCAAWSPDGRRVAVGGTVTTVRIWDPKHHTLSNSWRGCRS